MTCGLVTNKERTDNNVGTNNQEQSKKRNIKKPYLGKMAGRGTGAGYSSGCGECPSGSTVGFFEWGPNKAKAPSNIACIRRRVSFMSISDSSLETLEADSADFACFFPWSYGKKIIRKKNTSSGSGISFKSKSFHQSYPCAGSWRCGFRTLEFSVTLEMRHSFFICCYWAAWWPSSPAFSWFTAAEQYALLQPERSLI